LTRQDQEARDFRSGDASIESFKCAISFQAEATLVESNHCDTLEEDIVARDTQVSDETIGHIFLSREEANSASNSLKSGSAVIPLVDFAASNVVPLSQTFETNISPPILEEVTGQSDCHVDPTSTFTVAVEKIGDTIPSHQQLDYPHTPKLYFQSKPVSKIFTGATASPTPDKSVSTNDESVVADSEFHSTNVSAQCLTYDDIHDGSSFSV
jgi:hypothetical protein